MKDRSKLTTAAAALLLAGLACLLTGLLVRAGDGWLLAIWAGLVVCCVACRLHAGRRDNYRVRQ